MTKKELKDFIHNNERHLTAGALVLGFLVDTLTLSRVDLLFDNLILLFYLTLATTSIFILNRYPHKNFSRYITYLLQYAFGGLFSGFIIFYSQSASFVGSWLFVGIFVSLFIGNEFFKKRYLKTYFQTNILFVAIFSYLIFLLPVLTGKIGGFVFLASGLMSLFLIFVISYFLKKISLKNLSFNRGFKISIFTLYTLFNVLYFTNIIPPIPLSLKDLTIAYAVERNTDGSFLVETHKRPWYLFFKKDEILYEEGTTLYSFASVFAPTRIEARVAHQWSYFEEETDTWVPQSRITFNMTGGRDGGFRGYTFKNSLREGLWRVDVLTERNQLIGREEFLVIFVEKTPPLTKEIK